MSEPQALTERDFLTLADIDRAVASAKASRPRIVPVELDGKRFYPVLCRELTAEEISAAKAQGVEFFVPAELEEKLGFAPQYLDLGQGQP